MCDTINKIETVQALCNNDENATTAVVTAYLSKAESAIMRRAYPFGTTKSMPKMYDMLQCELAARYFFRMGSEGETMHSENGINRTYDSANDEDLLKDVTPHIKVV